MKALTFLEFYDLLHRDKLEYLSNLGYTKIIHENTALAIYYGIISADFKPELITELFEGWVYYDRKTIKHFTQEKWHIQFWNANEYMRTYNDGTQLEHGYDKLNMLYHFPDTLERFISNCQQAGIELQFKEATK